jgi:hypothetical protein
MSSDFSVSPEVRQGDPFIAAARRRDDCPLCYAGFVYIGHMVEEDGEEVEIIEAVPCRRCSPCAG